MLEPPLIPGDGPLHRLAQASLETCLADTPVVLVQGPRQCGKTTLARTVAEPLGYGYATFDDGNLARSARQDPLGFVGHSPLGRCFLRSRSMMRHCTARCRREV